MRGVAAVINYAIIRETYLRKARSHIGEREVAGSNRSVIIDSFCKRGGVDLGSSYCLLGATCVLDDACKELGLKNPVGVKAGTQKWFTAVPTAYKRGTGRTGFIGIFQDRKDQVHGHAVIVAADEDRDFDFNTVEFNTNPGGAANGDGVYARVRNAHGSSVLSLRGFVDVVQWVCDANGIKG